MTRAAKVDVFLSYNRADTEAAERLRDGLSARGLSVFFDRDYLAPGHRWQRVLETSLATCGAIAICVGPRGLGQWQQREKELALARQTADGGFPVIPVLLPGADDPGLDFLCLFSWADLRKGIDEPPELDALVRAIRGDAVPDRPDPRAGICPYRGLKPFREEDAAFFMGREDTSAQVTARVLGGPFTMVVGASGCGKSSVAFAGLLPRLRAGAGGFGWEIAALTPGARPLHRLMAALSPPPESLSRAQRLASVQRDVDALQDNNVGLAAFVDDIRAARPGTDRLLLLVDQFEELFTQCESDDDRDRFVDLLLAGTARVDGPLHVVLTLRGDFYGRALANRALADRLDGAVLNVGPMTGDELRRAIVEPAARVGLSFTDNLPERILDDVGSEPGHLPLLEFLLTELWRRREPDGIMTAAAYGAIGGVKRAIAARAEAELDRLSTAERQTARRVLVSLVRPGEGREDTRARAIVPVGDPAAQTVIRRFANARLLTTDHDDALNADTVEVSHEALIREWDTLKGWVDQDREFLRTLKRVRDAMAVWTAEQADRDSRLLPPGRPLEEARELLTRDDALIDDVRPFIQQSIAADEARRVTEQRRLDDESQRRLAEAEKLAAAERSRRKTAIAGLIAALVLVVVAGIFGWWAMKQERMARANEQEAIHQKQIAKTNEQEALRQAEIVKKRVEEIQRQESLRLAGLARQESKSGDAVTGMLLALEGLPKSFDPPDRPIVGEAAGALIEAMLEQRERVVLRGHEDRIRSAEFSPDEQRIVTASGDKTARVWNAETGSELARLAHRKRVYRAVFSPRGSRVLTKTSDNTIHLWEWAKERQIYQIRQKEDVHEAVFSPDGTRIVTLPDSGPVRIWDAANGELLLTLGNDDVDGYATFLSSRGRLLVTHGWDDIGARMWDTETGRQLFVLSGQRPLSFSEDGKKLLTTDFDGNAARIWDAFSGEELAILSGHERSVWIGSFSPNGEKAITGSRDTTARIWDVGSGQELGVLRGHGVAGIVPFVLAAFNRDGTRALTVSVDRILRLWNTNYERRDKVTRIAQLPCSRGAMFIFRGFAVATKCEDGALRIWLAEDGKEVLALRTATPIQEFAFNEEGERLVTTSYNTAQIWEAANEKSRTRLPSHLAGGKVLGFSPGGRHVLFEFSNAVVKWTLELHDESWLTDDLSDRGDILSAVITPDAIRLVGISDDERSVWLWEGRSGKTVATLRESTNASESLWPQAVVFSPDGSRLVVAVESHGATLYDGVTGQNIATLEGYNGEVISAEFSADGSKFVTSSKDGDMRLWNGRNGKQLNTVESSGDGDRALALSPDGTRVLEGGPDGTLRLRDAMSGLEIAPLRGHDNTVRVATFNSDGSRIATGSDDSTVRVWDADSGEDRVVIRGHPEPIRSIAFSPDSRTLIVASKANPERGTVRIWPVYRAVEELIAEANRRVPRQLTDEQRRRFFLQPAASR